MSPKTKGCVSKKYSFWRGGDDVFPYIWRTSSSPHGAKAQSRARLWGRALACGHSSKLSRTVQAVLTTRQVEGQKE